MKIYKTVSEAANIAPGIARSLNEVMVTVPLNGRFSREVVILTIKEWLDLCNERNFPVVFSDVFDKNGVLCDAHAMKADLDFI